MRSTILLLSFFFINSVHGQIFYPSQDQIGSLGASELSRYNLITNEYLTNIQDAYLMEHSSFFDTLQPGHFKILLKNGDCKLINLRITFLDYSDNGDFILSAETIIEDSV